MTHAPAQKAYRNVYRFSPDVAETAHDGHLVEILSTYIPDPDEPGAKMHHVRCSCGMTFEAFAEEVAE